MFGLGESSNGAKKALSQSARACRSARPAGDDPKSLPSGDDIAKTAAASASLLFMDDTGSVLVSVVRWNLLQASTPSSHQHWREAGIPEFPDYTVYLPDYSLRRLPFPAFRFGGHFFPIFPIIPISRFSRFARFSRFSRQRNEAQPPCGSPAAWRTRARGRRPPYAPWHRPERARATRVGAAVYRRCPAARST